MNLSNNYNSEDLLKTVYVVRTEKEMMAREESNSLLWDKIRKLPKGLYLFSIPLRDLKIGESIYSKNLRELAYRIS